MALSEWEIEGIRMALTAMGSAYYQGSLYESKERLHQYRVREIYDKMRKESKKGKHKS